MRSSWLRGLVAVLVRIDEACGHLALARAGYELFLRLYDLPAASQRPLVEEARAALAEH